MLVGVCVLSGARYDSCRHPRVYLNCIERCMTRPGQRCKLSVLRTDGGENRRPWLLLSHSPIIILLSPTNTDAGSISTSIALQASGVLGDGFGDQRSMCAILVFHSILRLIPPVNKLRLTCEQEKEDSVGTL